MDDLLSTSLIDCHGAVTHTLTLLIDGTVRIAFTGGTHAIVEPRTGVVLTPGRVVPPPLIAAARSLASGAH
jgi:hypothetical protein